MTEPTADDHEDDVRAALTGLVRGLVDFPDEVVVDAAPRGRSTSLSLQVAPEDVGKVIGRQGRTARALRTLLEARSLEDGHSYVLDIRRS